MIAKNQVTPFIFDRKGVMSMAVILEEQTLEFAPNASFGGIYHRSMSFTDESFEVGREYIVIWDGVTYSCTATKMVLGDMTGDAIGNGALFGIAEDTGEPFLFGYFPGDGSSAVVTDSTDATHTLTIYTEEETVGVSIVLYGRTGAAVNYDNVETITFDTPDKEKGAMFTYGVAVDNAEYEPNFSEGNQKVSLEKGQLLKEFAIKKPDTLTPANVRKNTSISGVTGTLAYIEEIETEEAMNALLTADNVGNAYRFIGESTENYVNGDLYVVEDNS